MRAKKISKIIGNILLFLLLLIVIFLVVMFIVNKSLIKKDMNLLDENGYVNIVHARDYNLNVSSYGSENGKHKFVAIAGSGVYDYSVTLRKVTDDLAEDNLIIVPERAGYGLSDDTSLPMTTENIVENYRAALKNAGFEAPYILLPHSLGSAYATYWESKYPEEIEGIVFLDASPLSDGDTFDMDDLDLPSPFLSTLERCACKIGLHRLAVHKFWYYLPDNYTQEEQKLADALDTHHGYSKALESENELMNDNCTDAYRSIVKNDIPKVYINASYGIRTMEEFESDWEWLNAQCEKNGIKRPSLSDEQYENIAKGTIEQGTEITETRVLPYLELMGNCECVNLGGDHFVYEQQPEECVKIIKEFMERVE